ncbi:hypothetical protein DTO169E5_6198 [Paecilomyces variotii]|nr:hypothetical protein DTO169E5_6198 [Paecilomyces variotii]
MELKLVAFLLLLLQLAAARTLRSTKAIRNKAQLQPAVFQQADVDPSLLYPAHNLSVPIDHFHNESKYEPHSDGTFSLRYWFDASHYKAGGPVIIIAAGETDGSDRLPYLQKGILAQLAQATNGIGVVLEHRYYGQSFPTPDLSTESLRFLTTEQALADTAFFARNVVFEGLEDHNFTAPNVPHIIYGGSYAGAFAALSRVIYPDVFFGAISSSGVTKAVYDYWEYFEPIRQFGPQDCIATTQKFVHILDNFLGKNDSTHVEEYKDLFGLGNLTYANDFANLLSSPLGAWQNRNWDPALNDPTFSYYCGNITSSSLLYAATENKESAALRLISAGGYKNESSNLTNRLLNFVGYLNLTQVGPCLSGGSSADACFSEHIVDSYTKDDLNQTWRSWDYQWCTQWGFVITGSGVPRNQLPLISRSIDIPYYTIPCRYAFNITSPPDTESINKYGGWNISYPRLAIIDGQADPWRPATPHADQAPKRPNTVDKPFILIEGAVHHWDENGLFPNETTPTLPPQPIADTQKEELKFVKEWLQEWDESSRNAKVASQIIVS